MLISLIILIITFIVMTILIVLGVFERFIVALGAGMIAFFVLFFCENATFDIFISFIVGTKEDNYTNFHALTLILGMMIIVMIAIEGGFFQFISFRLIQMTKGEPKRLLLVFCTLSLFMTAILNDILTIIILIPLTATICRILDIDALPYIIVEAIVVKLGGTLLIISSVPTILITSYLKISFTEYFLRIGIMTFVVFGLTLLFFLALFKNRFEKPRTGIDVLLSYSVWDFIHNKPLMLKSTIILCAAILGFIFIPSTIISPDIIAMSCALILLFISKIDVKEMMKKIDFKLILYLIGIFIITGAMEYVGLMKTLGKALAGASSDDLFFTFLIILWLSAFLTALVDNVSVVRILIPTVGIVTHNYSYNDKLLIYSGMIYGMNWGDSLLPFGDTLFVGSLAEENKVHFKLKEFFKFGFFTSLFELCVISIIFALILNLVIGVILLSAAIVITIISLVISITKSRRKVIGHKILRDLHNVDKTRHKKKKF